MRPAVFDRTRQKRPKLMFTVSSAIYAVYGFVEPLKIQRLPHSRETPPHSNESSLICRPFPWVTRLPKTNDRFLPFFAQHVQETQTPRV